MRILQTIKGFLLSKLSNKQSSKLPFKPLKLDLQYFADGEGEEYEYGTVEGGQEEVVVRGAYNPDEEIVYPQGNNPLWSTEEQEEQQQFGSSQEAEQPQEQPLEQPQEQAQVGQPNPQEQYIQQLVQQNQQMQQQMRQMAILQQQQMQQQPFQQQQQFQQPQAPAEPQLSIEEQNEKLMEKFYENPMGLFEEMKRQAVEEARKDFNPIIQERKIESEVQNLSQRYGEDFLSTIPQMQDLVTELGDAEVERMGLERVYLMARGMATQNQQPVYQQPQLSADQIFQDQAFINEYIAQNPAVQQAVMQQMMAQKQQQQPPMVMGQQFGGQPSFAPEYRPKSIAESSKLLRKSWNID